MNSRKLGVFIIIVFCSAFLNAQEKINIKKKEFKKTDQIEGFKEAWENVTEGDKYYSQGFGTFNLARDHYLFANSYNGYNAELNYKLGICYLFSDDKFKAIDFLLRAYELKPDISPEIKLLIGKAYHMVLKFDEARTFYLDYKQELPPGEELIDLTNKMEKLIIECTHGKEFIKEPKRVIIQNLGEEVNSAYDDYNPRFAFEDSALFFTSRRPLNKRSKRSELDNKYLEDIYVSKYSDGEFMPARPMGKPFNSKGNNAIVGVAPDGASVFMYLGKEDGGDIQQVFFQTEKDKWKKPKSLSKYIGSKSGETTAALSPDGMELYFVSANSEATKGGKDIFVTRMNSKGKWDEPRNMGSLINSKYDEEGIYLTADGNTMYFASKGHNSMGGFDIYRSDKDGDVWGRPVNQGYPINTPEDEVFYVTDATGVYGYFSSIREGGYGGKDIFKIIKLGSEKEVTTITKASYELAVRTDFPVSK